MQPQTLLLGSWTGMSGHPRAEKTAHPSEGIYRLQLLADGNLQVVDRLKTDNPSWIVVSQDQRLLYTTNESETGRVSAIEIAPQGPLRLLNSQQTRGAHPTHACLTPDGHYLLAANYSDGMNNAGFIVFPIMGSGEIGEAVQHVRFAEGSAVVAERQQSGHAHSVNISPDGKILYVADLGADIVRVYHYQPQNDTPFLPQPQDDIRLPGGAGPRHIAFSDDGRFVCVVSEMSAQVHLFQMNEGQLNAIQTLELADSDSAEDKAGAGVLYSPDGRFLYVGNRQQRNEIVVFSVDPHSGRLSDRQQFSSGGIEPRAFAFDNTGHFLLVANVWSNRVTVLARDPHNGGLRPTGNSLDIGTPTDIKFLR